MKIFKAVKNGYFYNKQRYWDTFGSMFFDLESLIQHIQYAKKYCSLDILEAEIVEFDVVEVCRHEIKFTPEIDTGESFENIQ